MNAPVCPACGARLAPGATQCDLCGHILGDERSEADERSGTVEAATTDVASPEPAEPAPSDVPHAAESIPASTVPEEALNGPFCIHCGAKNPAYARFCHNCGQALHTAESPSRPSGVPEGSVPVVQSVPVVPAATPGREPVRTPATTAATSERPDSDAGKRAFLLLGAGVLAVLMLFFITQASQNDPPASQPTGAVPTQAPASAPAQLSPEVAAEVAALEDAIAAAATDEERLERQEQLAGLYAQAGAFDRAAEVQQAIAEAQQTALSWADAGSLYLAHMLRIQGPERATYAQRAAENYERSLELDPEDLDVKTDLATAYLNDATNPMRAVQTVKEVLEADPDHVRANFNYGLMLAQINRVEQAQVQFEKVVSLTEPEDPVHQRAEQELARVQAVQSGAANG